MANPEDLGRYRLKRLLGRGALGEVWEATDREQAGVTVAVKIMHAAAEELTAARCHFAREARLASALRHPHVAVVYDAGEAAGTSFMVMDMVEGTSLRKVIRDSSSTIAERLDWLRQIAEGLSAMHRVGLAHRDLKPENVIIRGDRSACIVDLGIAKWRKFDFDEEHEPFASDFAPNVHTPYVPPETRSSEIYDELSDQYAWGTVAHELLTGHAPGDVAAPLTDRDDVPRHVAMAIERARSHDRDQRWMAMEFVIAGLDGATEASVVSSTGVVEIEASVDDTRTAPEARDARGRAELDAPRTGAAESADPAGRRGFSISPGLGIAALIVLLILVTLVAAGLR